MHDVLIIFVKYPEAGRVKTRIAGELGPERASEIYSRMAKAVIDNVSKPDSYGTVVFFDPPDKKKEVKKWLAVRDESLIPQSRGSLGDRMSHAMDHVFSNGAKRAVIIGTDCPDVTQATVRQAFDALEATDVAIGPAFDGGYYLLGLNAPEPAVFRGIEWSTNLVLSQTIERLRAAGLSWRLLETLRDIDGAADIDPGFLRSIGLR